MEKKAYYLLKDKEHLTEGGLCKIIDLKASINLGLSPKLEKAFTDITPVDRPLVQNKKIPDPNWLAGFTAAEGCFYVEIFKSKTILGFSVKLVFSLVQHARDEQLIINLVEYLNCGSNFQHSKNAVRLIVSKLSDIEKIIIPFFKNYRILGIKSKDFNDWCKVADLMKDKKTFN